MLVCFWVWRKFYLTTPSTYLPSPPTPQAHVLWAHSHWGVTAHLTWGDVHVRKTFLTPEFIWVPVGSYWRLHFLSPFTGWKVVLSPDQLFGHVTQVFQDLLGVGAKRTSHNSVLRMLLWLRQEGMVGEPIILSIARQWKQTSRPVFYTENQTESGITSFGSVDSPRLATKLSGPSTAFGSFFSSHCVLELWGMQLLSVVWQSQRNIFTEPWSKPREEAHRAESWRLSDP